MYPALRTLKASAGQRAHSPTVSHHMLPLVYTLSSDAFHQCLFSPCINCSVTSGVTYAYPLALEVSGTDALLHELSRSCSFIGSFVAAQRNRYVSAALTSTCLPWYARAPLSPLFAAVCHHYLDLLPSIYPRPCTTELVHHIPCL